jgi:glyoxylase-like metal-dependent hydrolase (beta-lactamase superfamily II)
MLNVPFLEKLEAAGARPDEIDLVMCTHLHHDHIGWNTTQRDGRWVPTFRNARYVFSKPEVETFAKLDADPAHGAVDRHGYKGGYDLRIAGNANNINKIWRTPLPPIHGAHAAACQNLKRIDNEPTSPCVVFCASNSR